MRMIILAAGQGTRLRPLTDDRPKCLVELSGKPLLDWQLEAASAAGVSDVVVVSGYRSELVLRPGIRSIRNADYEHTNMVHSLFCAEELFSDGIVVSYGDIVYTVDVLERLLNDPSDAAIVVDRDWQSYWSARFDDPLSDAESLNLDGHGRIRSIGQPVTDIRDIQGQYIGLMAFRGQGIEQLRGAYRHAQETERDGAPPFGGPRPLARMYMTDLLQGMIALGAPLTPVWIQRGWYEVDSIQDLELAACEWLSVEEKATC